MRATSRGLRARGARLQGRSGHPRLTHPDSAGSDNCAGHFVWGMSSTASRACLWTQAGHGEPDVPGIDVQDIYARASKVANGSGRSSTRSIHRRPGTGTVIVSVFGGVFVKRVLPLFGNVWR